MERPKKGTLGAVAQYRQRKSGEGGEQKGRGIVRGRLKLSRRRIKPNGSDSRGRTESKAGRNDRTAYSAPAGHENRRKRKSQMGIKPIKTLCRQTPRKTSHQQRYTWNIIMQRKKNKRERVKSVHASPWRGNLHLLQRKGGESVKTQRRRPRADEARTKMILQM